MVRTIITPQDNILSLTLPDNLIGRKIEVIAFAVEEIEPVTEPLIEHKFKPSQMRGFLSAATAEAMQLQIDSNYFRS